MFKLVLEDDEALNPDSILLKAASLHPDAAGHTCSHFVKLCSRVWYVSDISCLNFGIFQIYVVVPVGGQLTSSWLDQLASRISEDYVVATL